MAPTPGVCSLGSPYRSLSRSWALFPSSPAGRLGTNSLWPLIAVNGRTCPRSPWALALRRGAYSSQSDGPIMAGAVLSALPLLVVFLVANQRIVEGVRLSGLNG